MKFWRRAATGVLTALLVLRPAGSETHAGRPTPSGDPAEEMIQTAPASTEEELVLEPPPESPLPEEYEQGRGYVGSFPAAWDTARLFDPISAKLFLALQDGAPREELEKLGIPDLDLAIKDLVEGRLVREAGRLFRPAFPVIRGKTREAFGQAVQAAADRVYTDLRPHLKKIRKAARKEKVLPWLYALAWSDLLESKSVEEALADAGALDSARLRNEGYFWIFIPNDSYLTGVDRYGSGSETLHYLWTAQSYLDPALEDISTRREILDHALSRLPWDDAGKEEAMAELGILDSRKQVRVPVLRKKSRLLVTLRLTAQIYAKSLLHALKPGPLSHLLGVQPDEAFAAAYACVGFTILARAEQDGFLSRPEFLIREDAPSNGLVYALVITEDESADALERAYYHYDRGEFTEAIQQADRFLETRPGDPEALFRKGISQMKLRKYEEALETLERALPQSARPADVWRGWTLIRIGNILDVLQRRDEAVKRYEEALGYFSVSGSHQTARLWLENVYRD